MYSAFILVYMFTELTVCDKITLFSVDKLNSESFSNTIFHLLLVGIMYNIPIILF